MAKLVNRAKMTTATTGTANAVLGSAVDGFQTFAAAGVSDGDVVGYAIDDGDNFEVGTGTYTASGTTLSRSNANVTDSSNGNNRISLSGNAVVYVTALANDLLQPQGQKTLTGGFDSDPESLGTVTSGTVTPEVDGEDEENFKTLTANGAFTLAPPSTSASCTILIHVTNGAAAGTITTSGFDIVNGDDYETTNNNEYFFHIKKVGSATALTIEALQ